MQKLQKHNTLNVLAILFGLLITSSSTPKNLAKNTKQIQPYRVVKHDPKKAYKGTTIFADNSYEGKSKIVEVDMQGHIVWQYVVPPKLFNGKHSKKSIVMDVEKLPSGDILFNIQEVGFYRINKKGKVVFKHLDSGISHDIDLLPNGNYLYVRGWAPKGEDHVVEIDTKGNKVWTWDGISEFNHPPFANIYDQGWIHVNSTTRFENGNTLISLRNFNLIAEIDRNGIVVWKRKLGSKKAKSKAHPHDPEAQQNGNILVALTGANKAIEFAREGGPPIWEFAYPKGSSKQHIRDINHLPNQNKLLVQANTILELSPENEIVWQLYLPSIKINSRNKNTFLFKAQRIGEDGSISGH